MRFSKVDFSITPYVEGVTLPVSKPDPQFLAEIGEEGMRDLLDRFYMKLYESPVAHLFPADRDEMKTAAQHSADFFIQICGGPAYFSQNRGAPQMRKRHAPFAITPEARLHWLVLFEEALMPLLEEQKCSETTLQSFWRYLDTFSQWMVNSRG